MYGGLASAVALNIYRETIVKNGEVDVDALIRLMPKRKTDEIIKALRFLSDWGMIKEKICAGNTYCLSSKGKLEVEKWYETVKNQLEK